MDAPDGLINLALLVWPSDCHWDLPCVSELTDSWHAHDGDRDNMGSSHDRFVTLLMQALLWAGTGSSATGRT